VGSKFPPWIKIRIPASINIESTAQLLEELKLNTVCQSAICPNIGECFAQKTATFMIMGEICTRNCAFCAVKKGIPTPLDLEEPQRIAEAAEKLGLRHIVITSVTRDDLHDGGAGHFLSCITAIRKLNQSVIIEVLTPDFCGSETSLDLLLSGPPDIFNHNLETIPRLYQKVRPQASYTRSISLLENVKSKTSSVYTKSGLMVGLGETFQEIKNVLQDLHNVGCDIVTIGQYLRPSSSHLEVVEYIKPEIFEEYRKLGEEIGFMHVAAAPLVRSSFHAEQFSNKFMKNHVTL